MPAQNIVYADVDGNIGYQSPGRIPVRGKGDGTWPAPGWDSGVRLEAATSRSPSCRPCSTRPRASSSPPTRRSSATQYPHLLTRDWAYGYRSQRIIDMIATRPPGKISPEDMRQMQFDNRNGFAPTLVPALLAASS